MGAISAYAAAGQETSSDTASDYIFGTARSVIDGAGKAALGVLLALSQCYDSLKAGGESNENGGENLNPDDRDAVGPECDVRYPRRKRRFVEQDGSGVCACVQQDGHSRR